MKYRDAKVLKANDLVCRSSDKTYWIVQTTEVFGQYKKVFIHCKNESNDKCSLYNNEIE